MKERIEKLIDDVSYLEWELSQIDGSGRHDEFFKNLKSFEKAEEALIAALDSLKAARWECV